MANPGRGGGQPQTGKGASAGQRGGNRGGAPPRTNPNGPGNDRQAQGKDPHRGEPG
jgi:hypothetical protein